MGRVVVCRRLPADVARTLLERATDTHGFEPELRESWLEASTDLDRGVLEHLTETARHRLVLAVLRQCGLGAAWRQLYGSGLSTSERLQRVVVPVLRRQAGTSSDERGAQSAAGAVVGLFQHGKLPDAPLASAHSPLQGIVDQLILPMRNLTDRVTEWLRPLIERMNALVNQRVLKPALQQSLRFLGEHQRAMAAIVARPTEALLRSRDQALRNLRFTSQGVVLRPAESDLVERPDDATLVAFYTEERADLGWRTGPFGWLLTHLPLQLGGVLHERYGSSAKAALAWVAERFARREMRNAFMRVINTLECSASLRQRLEDGVGLFFDSHWSSADSLLTSALEGLLFEMGEARGVLTPGHRLMIDGAMTRGRIKTGSDGRLLHALGFSVSQKSYLTQLSIGTVGNPPRHGQDADFGPMEHSAAVLLGIVMLAVHQEQLAVPVARLLTARELASG